MGLFGDKKKGTDSLKTLSERDIQSKLYGHLRNASGVIQEDLPALSKPRQESQTVHKSSDALKTLTPSVSQVKTASGDLFTESPAVRRTEEETAKQEPKTTASKIHFEKQQVKPVTTPSRGISDQTKGIAGAFAQVIKQVAFKMAEAFATALSALLSLVFSIDFRKPAVRRFSYGIAAATAIILIFTGIHHLNKNREIAMKAPPKKVIEQAKKSKNAHPSEALQSALSSTASEAPADETQKSPDGSEKIAAEMKKRGAEKTPAKTLSAEVKKVKPAAEPVRTEVKKEAAPEAAAAVQTPGAVIQVATFATQEDAGKLSEKFKVAGFNSFFKSVSRSGGRVYYCVYIGKFATQQEAESKLAEFKKQEVARSFQDAFVRSL